MMLFPGSLKLHLVAVSRQRLLGASVRKNIIRNYSRNPECSLEAEYHRAVYSVCPAHATGLFKSSNPPVLQGQTPDALSNDAVQASQPPAQCLLPTLQVMICLHHRSPVVSWGHSTGLCV